MKNKIKNFVEIVKHSNIFIKKINSETVVPFLQMCGMNNGFFNPVYEKFKKIKFSCFHAFKNNDIIIAAIDSCFRANKINIAKLKDGFDFGLCSSSTIVLRLKNNTQQLINVEFLHWVLKSHDLKHLLISSMRGSDSRRQIDRRILLNYEIKNFPSLEEQTKIAQYLNEKIYNIQKSIELYELIIKKLKEYLKILIYENVKGMGQGVVKMKKINFLDGDEGRIFAEYFQEIPEHWEVMKFKDFFYIVSGNTPDTIPQTSLNKDSKKGSGGGKEEHWINGEYSLINGTELSRAEGLWVKEAERKLTKAGVGVNPLRIAPLNSLLVMCIGEKLGNVKMAGNNMTSARGVVNLIFKEQAKDIRKGERNEIEHYYKHSYKYYLYFIRACKDIWRGAIKPSVTMIGISSKEMKEKFLIVPPLKEQINIAQFLEEKEKDIKKTIEKNELMIVKLKKYQESLIDDKTKQNLQDKKNSKN